ncbi:MAG: putative toxin-antitoxin system toxin component, PIN family [Sandaracinaceae bacterium]
MRLVVDTNVLVSAMLKAGSVPDRALLAAYAAGAEVVYDARIRAEYEEVARRPKFRKVPRDRVEACLSGLLGHGAPLDAVPAWTGAMSDEDDRMFVEVALHAQADAIVTGNGKDFPEGLGFEVLPPAVLLGRLRPDA